MTKDKTTPNEAVNALKAIFEKHGNERICVVGTMCCGKTTLIKQLHKYNCIDMDDEFWTFASKEEIDFYSQRPFTKEMNDSLFKLFNERVSVKSGFPSFGVFILDCEVVVYLDIAESLLNEHCNKRGDTNFSDAHNIKKWIEDDLTNHKQRKDKAIYYVTIKE
jgi:shikimate kinase